MMTKYNVVDTTNRERGTAMIFVLLAGLLVAPVLQRASFHHANAFRENRSATALHLAEGGIDEAMWHLVYGVKINGDATWSGWTPSTDPETGNQSYLKPQETFLDSYNKPIGNYSLNVVLEEDNAVISAIAGVPDIDSPGSEIRRVVVVADRDTTFPFKLFSDLAMDFAGNNLVNSYDSCSGPYDVANAGNGVEVGSNNDITLQNSSLVDGNVTSAGNVIRDLDTSVSGETVTGSFDVELESVSSLVETAKLANNNGEIPNATAGIDMGLDLLDDMLSPISDSGVVVYDPTLKELLVPNDLVLTLPGGTKDNPKVYYFSMAVISDNAQLAIKGYANIFIDGDFYVSGTSVVNGGGSGIPNHLRLFSSGDLSTSIQIYGDAQFAGIINAPGASIQFDGNSDAYGMAIGGKIDFSSAARFHSDECLGSNGPLQVIGWIESFSLSSEF